MSARDLQSRRPDGAAPYSSGQPAQLADVLERVLDKGIVIAGDIKIDLLDIELLTVRIRLLVASADKAREMGIDWWEGDPFLNRAAQQRELEERLKRLENAAGIESPNGGDSSSE
jgi:gas vesicle protein GvpA/GvpJ/GvpM family